MALISKTIPNLVNGVSQQPATIRNPTQCAVQENLLSDAVSGVVHRPHTSFIAKLQSLGTSPKVPYVYTINQNSSSRYKVVITNGDLKVFDLLGAEKTVSFPNGKAYLNSTNPTAQFQCLTLGKNTYILNRSATVLEDVVAADGITKTNGALVFIKQGDYGTDYSITVSTNRSDTNTTYGPIQVTKTTSATLITDVKTSQIATDLKTALDAAALGTGLTTDRSGSVLFLYPTQPTTGFSWSMKVSSEDSKGNTDHRLVRSQIQKFSDLPTIAPNFYSVTIVGDKTSGFDDYYVQFKTDDSSAYFANGSWSEFSPVRKRPRPSLMPLKLTDNQDGTFTCAEESWAFRDAGDLITNPAPSFVGKTIQYLFTFGNRLGILAGDRVIMSEVGQYTNFYLTTVTTFLDSDPIDVQPLQSHDDWLYAIPLAEKIILFSRKGQAVCSGGGLLTPKTATLETATGYPVSSTCEPILVGKNIVFTADSGDYSRVYEYFIQKQVETLEASEISSHVPKYIPKGITRLTGDDANKLIIAMGTQENGVNNWYDLWIYRYFWINDQKVQSSWSRWKFPQNLMLVDVSLIDGILYFMSVDKNVGHLLFHSMDLDFTKKDVAATAYTRTHLDFRLDGSALSLATVGTTRTLTLPFSISAAAQGTFKIYRKEAQTVSPRVSWGVAVPITSWNAGFMADSNQVSYGDPDGLIGAAVWLGFPYTSTFTFSEIHLKEDQNGNQVPTEAGHLTIKRLDVLFNETVYMRGSVTPSTNRDTRLYPVTPYVLGVPTALSSQVARSGKLSLPINAQNDRYTASIINDSVVPHRLQSAEWTGNYTIKSKRV